MKKISPFIKVFFILIISFFLAMTLVYCIPVSRIQDNVEKSVEVLEKEGDYPVYFFYRHSGIVDEHTDKLMYTSLIPDRDYGNPVQASVSVNQYPRYWHGYQVILRPLTVCFQVQELRYLGMYVFHLLFFWSAWLMAKKLKLSIAVCYVAAITSGYIVFLPVCFQFFTTFAVLFTALIVLLTRYEKKSTANWMLYFFCVGMFENFFDFLTYPIITLGFPLIVLLWLKIRDEEAGLRENFLFMIKSSVSWGLGYALTWIAKWGIATVVLGVRYFWRTMSVVQYRLEGSAEEPLDRIGTLWRNLKAWLNVQDGGWISWDKVVIILLLAVVILLLTRKWKDAGTVAASLPIGLTACYPYIWYLVMSNHSQIHYWYTYRAQVLTLFGILVFVSCILKEKRS